MTDFSEHRFITTDGIALYFRRYNSTASTKAPTIVCLHGLTRNARDFEDIAPDMAALGHDVLCLDMRGRGKSDYDLTPENYTIPTYANDVLQLLAHEQIHSCIFIGTSMGGLITMVISLMKPDIILGSILNDIGPEVDPKGLERIADYVGGKHLYSSWDEACEGVRAINQSAFPKQTGQDFWLAFAKRVCRENESGKISLDYDIAISENMKSNKPPPPDLWPLFEILAQKPLLLVRGALTDLLTLEAVTAMKKIAPDMVHIDLLDIGHAPLLTEPESRSAIYDFLGNIR